MQFQKPVPQPRYREGPGVILSLQLQFHNWDVSLHSFCILHITFAALRALLEALSLPLPIPSFCL